MEHAIGRKIRFKGCVYIVVKDETNAWKGSCGRCILCGKACYRYFGIFGECRGTLRSDGEPVHFEHFGVDFNPTRHRHAF